MSLGNKLKLELIVRGSEYRHSWLCRLMGDNQLSSRLSQSLLCLLEVTKYHKIIVRVLISASGCGTCVKQGGQYHSLYIWLSVTQKLVLQLADFLNSCFVFNALFLSNFIGNKLYGNEIVLKIKPPWQFWKEFLSVSSETVKRSSKCALGLSLDFNDCHVHFLLQITHS